MRLLTDIQAAAILLVLLMLVLLRTPALGAAFERKTIDPSNSGRIAIGDIDGDGQNDIVVHTWGTNRGHVGDGTLVWYRYPSWEKETISDGENYYGDEIRAVDLDEDGDVDIIAPLGQHFKGTAYAELYWYENGQNGEVWSKQKVFGRIDGGEVKDLHLHDLDKDGRLDVAARLKEEVVICYQTEGPQWNRVRIKIQAREGSAVGDIDSDGFEDLVCNGYWLKNPGSRTKAWERYNMDDLWYAQTSFLGRWFGGSEKKAPEPWRRFAVRADVGDLDEDGKIDVVFCQSEDRGFPVVWYSSMNPTGGQDAWIAHELAIVDYCHTLHATDFDLDGDLDLLAASTKWAGDRSQPCEAGGGQVIIFWNDGTGRFRKELIGERFMYCGVVGDIDNDGDPDVVSSCSWEDGPITLWRNMAISKERKEIYRKGVKDVEKKD